MKKRFRIKKNEDFQEVFKKGKSTANRQFVLYILNNNHTHFRVGLSVSKKLGKAVTRNQIKRYIRQFCLEEKERLHNKDYVIIARAPAASMNFFEVKKSLLHVFHRAEVLQ